MTDAEYAKVKELIVAAAKKVDRRFFKSMGMGVYFGAEYKIYKQPALTFDDDAGFLVTKYTVANHELRFHCRAIADHLSKNGMPNEELVFTFVGILIGREFFFMARSEDHETDYREDRSQRGQGGV